jgi:hypothetical protein
MPITYPLTLPATPGVRDATWSPMAAVAGFASPFTLQQQVQAHAGQMWRVRFALPPMDDLSAGQWIATLLALNGRQGTFLFGDTVRKTPLGTAGGTPVVSGAGQTGQSILTSGWPSSTNGNLVKGDKIQIGTSVGSVLSGVFGAVPSWLTDVMIISRTSTQVTVRFSNACPALGGTLDWKVGSIFGIKNINPGAAEVSVVAGTGTPRLYAVLNDVNSDGSGNAVIDIWPRLRESPENNATIFLTDCKGVFRLKDNEMDWDINFAKRYGLEIEAVEAF